MTVVNKDSHNLWVIILIFCSSDNHKRVREERANTVIFTWFGNPHLRPRLQVNQA